MFKKKLKIAYFMKKDYSGVLITFEGVDGSGHTTHSRLTAEYFNPFQGISVVYTREPGGTEFGERVREVLLSPTDRESFADLLLFEAARCELVRRIIKPALENGSVVISDRYTDSSLAYQGYGGGLDLGLIRRMNKLATDNITPDLTLLFDIDVETAAPHLSNSDYFERKGDIFILFPELSLIHISCEFIGFAVFALISACKVSPG